MARDREQVELASFQNRDADGLRDLVRETASATNYNYEARKLLRFQGQIRLANGLNIQLHHLRRRDRELLKEFFIRCSAEARRFRFLSSIKAPSDSLLNYLAEADGSRHVALIVTQGPADEQKIVAEGRYVVFNERRDAADIALLVVDEMQRRGIGTLLVNQLMEIAWRNGVTRFSADVLAENRAMLSLLRKTGQGLTTTVSSGVIHFEIPITEEIAHIYCETMTPVTCLSTHSGLDQERFMFSRFSEVDNRQRNHRERLSMVIPPGLPTVELHPPNPRKQMIPRPCRFRLIG